MLRRPLALIACLLAFLMLVEDAEAQRRSSGGGRSSGSSATRSSGSSGGSRSVSRSTGGSRSSAGRATSSRSSGSSFSRPSSSRSSGGYSPSRSSGSSRASSSRSYDASRSSTQPRTVVVQPRGESRSTGTESGRSADSWRAPDTAAAPTRSTTTVTRNPRDLSRPIDAGTGVIDLSDAGVAPRVRFPRAADSFRSDSLRSREQLAPGSGRNLSQELRSRVSTDELSRMRTAAGAAEPTYRSQSVTRDDILSRYSGARTPSSSRGAAGPSTRAADPRVARRAAADTQGLAAGRRAAGAREAQARVADARAAKGAHDAERAANVREGMKAENQERIERARENYLRSLSADASGGTGGDGQGGGDGYDDGYHDGWHDGHHHHDHHWHLHWNYWGHWWGHGYWGWNWCGPTWGFHWWWHCYWWNGGYWFPGHCPSYYWYGPWYPKSTVIIQAGDTSDQDVIYVYDDDPEVIVLDGGGGSNAAPQDQVYAPTVVPKPAEGSGEGLNRAADYYLTLGDRAFRDGRYADAVHFYAKSVEYGPGEGILYLILSDALFASGDYHYAAYALRKAFELDPALATSVVDKHSFYSDPAEFDRQLAVLERYLEDHFLDDDARLVLAANYLFGGRPAAAVDLLESAFSLEVKRSPAGQKIFEAAQAIQHGVPQPHGALGGSGGTPD